MFDNAKDIKDYAQAGFATLTITSQRTNVHYTYKIIRAKDDNGAPKDLWFVGLLSGSNNQSDYTYMGMINGTFKLTAKSRYTAESTPVRAFQWVWRHVEQDIMPPETTVQHEGHCGRCGRTLTHPDSITRGIGPECIKNDGRLRHVRFSSYHA